MAREALAALRPPAAPPGGRVRARSGARRSFRRIRSVLPEPLNRWTARGGPCQSSGVGNRAQPTNPPAADRCPLRSEVSFERPEGRRAPIREADWSRRERPARWHGPPRACGTQDAAKPARFRQSGRSGTGVDSPGSVAVFPWHPVQPPLTHRMASDTHDSGQPRRREMPVWLPWLAAPAFALLPIAGCGAAATLRHTAHKAPAPAVASRPLVPITAVVTALPPGR